MTHDQERARQEWYERGRQDASTRTLLTDAEREQLAATDPEHLAAYEAGAQGGPRPPMSAEYVVEGISQKATGMLSQGEAPQVVRVGQAQAAALQQGGHTEDTLTVPAARITEQRSTQAGDTTPTTQSGQVSLLIEHTAEESRLEVL